MSSASEGESLVKGGKNSRRHFHKVPHVTGANEQGRHYEYHHDRQRSGMYSDILENSNQVNLVWNPMVSLPSNTND